MKNGRIWWGKGIRTSKLTKEIPNRGPMGFGFRWVGPKGSEASWHFANLLLVYFFNFQITSGNEIVVMWVDNE